MSTYGMSRRRYALPLLALCLLVIATGVAGVAPSAHAQSTSASPVNVAGVVLFVDCPDLVQNTGEVKFAYVQLDGNAAVRSATTKNGGLVRAGNVPAVQFARLSFDFTQDSLYRFILTSQEYADLLVEPQYWSVDRRNAILYLGLSC